VNLSLFAELANGKMSTCERKTLNSLSGSRTAANDKFGGIAWEIGVIFYTASSSDKQSRCKSFEGVSSCLTGKQILKE
jgi:hypothetical protein